MGGLLYLIFHLLLAYWVYQDAKKRNMSALWAVGALLVPEVYIVIILYLIFRKPESYVIEEDIARVCFNCGKKIREGDRYCPHCGADTQKPR